MVYQKGSRRPLHELSSWSLPLTGALLMKLGYHEGVNVVLSH